MGLGVAEGIKADDGVVRQHPLAGGHLPEDVSGEPAIEGDGGQKAHGQGQAEQRDDPGRKRAGRHFRPGVDRCGAGSRGGPYRRHFLDRIRRSRPDVHPSPSDTARTPADGHEEYCCKVEASWQTGCGSG
jgi:hypothetical protein